MADFDIIVGARDEATRILQGVRNETDTLASSISNLREKAEGETSKVEIAFSGLGAALAALAGAAALFGSAKAFGSFGTKSVKEFGDQEAAATKLAERMMLAEGRLKGLRDSEIDVVAGADEVTKAFEKMADAGTLIGSQEHILGYTNGIKMAKEATDRAYASFGAIIAPLETLRNESIESVANALTAVLAPAVQLAEDSFESYRMIVDIVSKESGEALVAGMTLAVTAFENVSALVDIAVASFALGYEMMKNDFVHLFTEVIPVYANWFVENFPELMSDGLAGAFIAIKNFVTNGSEAFMRLFEFVRTGGKGGFAGLVTDIEAIASKNILEGFKATAAELPDVIGRSFTDKETELATKIAGLGVGLGKDFSESFEDNLAYFHSLFEDGLGVNVKLPDEIKGGKKSGGAIAENKAEDTRLLARNTTKDPIEDLVAEVKVQKDIAGKQLEAAEEANRILRSKQGEIIVEIVG